MDVITRECCLRVCVATNVSCHRAAREMSLCAAHSIISASASSGWFHEKIICQSTSTVAA